MRQSVPGALEQHGGRLGWNRVSEGESPAGANTEPGNRGESRKAAISHGQNQLPRGLTSRSFWMVLCRGKM